jgi:hypothetical protein
MMTGQVKSRSNRRRAVRPSVWRTCSFGDPDVGPGFVDEVFEVGVAARIHERWLLFFRPGPSKLRMTG